MSDKALRSSDFEHRLAELEKRVAARGTTSGTFPPLSEPPIARSDKARRDPTLQYSPPSEAPMAETPLIRHNQLGEVYSVKLVYPGFYLAMMPNGLTTVVGFPVTKERLAKRVTPGHMFFIYVTSPERRIIGMAQATGPAEFAPEKDFKRPWSVDLAWVIGPKMPGVQFTEIGLQIKARVGDSTYSITDEVASAIIERLQDMDDLGSVELSRLKERYRMFG